MSSQKDTNDVLDFINSLPDSKNATPQPAVGKRSENKDELLNFLDELESHEKSKPSTPTPSKSKFEPKKKPEFEEKHENKIPEKQPLASPPKSEVKEKEYEEKESEAQPSANEELNIDPIGSISSWWQSEGSSKVSSLWGSLTTNAHQISEQTYNLASTTTNQLNQQRQKIVNESQDFDDHVGNISNRLNSILSTMSHQIKQGLIGKDDELLNILLVNDLDNVQFLSYSCENKFNKVMNQVEGGIRVSVSNFNQKSDVAHSNIVELNMFHGKLIDGEKLCAANLDSSIKDFHKIVEQKEANTSESKNNDDVEEINRSNIFISIQPISTKISRDDLPEQSQETSSSEGVSIIDQNNSSAFSFTLILKDVTNNITLITKSQPFPYSWYKWLRGEQEEFADFSDVNPGEWVKGWVEEGISLSFGVLAQAYVSKRMGLA